MKSRQKPQAEKLRQFSRPTQTKISQEDNGLGYSNTLQRWENIHVSADNIIREE
jgi:hypothetical protein